MNDFRYALRQLLRHFGFSLAAIVTLGIGIGLVATQYSLVDGMLLRPLPFAHADRIRHVAASLGNEYREWSGIPLDTFAAMHEQQTAFERLAGTRSETYNLAAPGELPQRLWGAAVTPEFFDILAVPPLLGRHLQAADSAPGAPPRAVIAHKLYVETFGSDPSVIGRSVRLNGEQVTIVGVMPEGFMFPGTESVWVRLRLPPPGAPVDPLATVEAMGLLADGQTDASAAAQLAAVGERQRRESGQLRDGRYPVFVQSFQRAYNGGSTAELLMTLLAMTGFVLLLACINVANLLFVRGTDRLRELSVRSALGAGRRHIVRQLLAESLLLGLGGALLGIALAAIGSELLQWQLQTRLEMPTWMTIELNPRVLAVTVLIAAGAGLLAGALPAVRAARMNLADNLKNHGRGQVGGGLRVGPLLSAGQLAFACAAMVVAGLLGLSILQSARQSLAFDPDSLLIGRLELQGPAYAEPAQRTAFYQRLIERVEAVPGVAAAAVSSRDLVNPGVTSPVELAGADYPREQDRPNAWLEVVSRGYFDLIGRPPISGRLFDDGDRTDSQPVALVNRSFAARHWPGTSAIGQRLRRGVEGSPWVTVVGVVPDLHLQGVGNNGDEAGWYLLQDQQAWGWLDLVVRTKVEPLALIDQVRTAVASIDPLQPIHSITNLNGRTAQRLAGMHIIGAMAGVFAIAAFVLAAVGVYSVMAYRARQRRREFGLRVALGAASNSIQWMMLRQSATPTFGGIGIGLLLGLGLSRPLIGVMEAGTANDLRVYFTVALVLGIAAMLACWWPARRASTVDPTVTLRGE